MTEDGSSNKWQLMFSYWLDGLVAKLPMWFLEAAFYEVVHRCHNDGDDLFGKTIDDVMDNWADLKVGKTVDV